MGRFLQALKKSNFLVNFLIIGLKIDIWAKIAISVAILVFVSTLSLSYFFPNLDFRLSLFLTGLIFIGMPHGAMDIYLVHQLLKPKKIVILALIAYVGLSIPILILWPLYPTSCFLFFLSYSLIHFADSDIQERQLPKAIVMIEFLARVNLPFCLPFIFYNKETLLLVKWIHPSINLQAFTDIFYSLGYFSLAFVAINTLFGLIRFVKHRKEADIAFLEPVVVSALFIYINPLFALGIYFCFIHSLKHIVNVLLKVKIRSAKTILPYWLFPLAGIPIMFFIYSKNQLALGENIFQYILIVLSSLALPHALLIRYAKSKLIIN